MIDWVSAKLPFYYPGVISDGQMMSLTRDGEVEFSVHKRMMVAGSYESRVSMRTAEVDLEGNTCVIEFSGNPVKFLQGHNLFGSSDLLNLMAETFHKLSELLSAPQPAEVVGKVLRGAYTLSRVDINRMFSLGDRAEVHAYTYALSKNARTRSQAAVVKGSTVYFNKTSKRWSFKFYSKGQEAELIRNKKDVSIEMPTDLKGWVDPMLRAELTLKSNELRKRKLHLAYNWHTIEEYDIFANYAERIEMPEQKQTAEIVEKIKSRPAIATYTMWCDGHDVRAILPQNTFYRHRRLLLEHGIDISIAVPSEAEAPTTVVPFKKTLELRPAVLPGWVPGTEYLYEPRKLCIIQN